MIKEHERKRVTVKQRESSDSWKTRRPRAREGQLHLELGPHKPRSVRNACPSVNLDRQPRPVHTDVCVGGMVFRLCVVTCSVSRMPISECVSFSALSCGEALEGEVVCIDGDDGPKERSISAFRWIQEEDQAMILIN